MNVLYFEEVIRYFIVFNAEEVFTMRELGHFPPDCAIPLRMWMTVPEIKLAANMLGYGEAFAIPDVPRAPEYEVVVRKLI